MERIWQWAWDRYGSRYSWVICGVFFASILSVSLLSSFVVVAFERSSHYVQAAAVTGVVVAVLAYVVILPGSRRFHLAQRWAAGREVDRAAALEDTYTWTRAAAVRGLAVWPVMDALLFVVVGATAGASEPRLIQYGILGVATPQIWSVPTPLWKEHCGQPGLPSPGTRESATPFPVLARLLPQG